MVVYHCKHLFVGFSVIPKGSLCIPGKCSIVVFLLSYISIVKNVAKHERCTCIAPRIGLLKHADDFGGKLIGALLVAEFRVFIVIDGSEHCEAIGAVMADSLIECFFEWFSVDEVAFVIKFTFRQGKIVPRIDDAHTCSVGEIVPCIIFLPEVV